MASIEKKRVGDGFSYRIQIRKKGIEIYKTFSNEEDAKLYIFYKERLIDNMTNFDIPLKDRVTLEQLFELKKKACEGYDKRTLNELDNVFNRVNSFIGENKFFHEISYDQWLSIAKSVYEMDVFRGSKTNIIKMSPITLRRYFATLSSVISHAISLGISLENYPLKVMKTYINPLIKIHKS